ncbi:MAG: hypothetical protein KJO87_05995, partial [Acidimicrobiia bacterium]|nr:hypothetical protein [Acidimicrobiia bacterium]
MTDAIADAIAALSGDERRLVEAAAIAGRPVPLAAAVALGSWDEAGLLDAGDRLSSAGLLTQTAGGFLPTEAVEQATADMGEMRRSA